MVEGKSEETRGEVAVFLVTLKANTAKQYLVEINAYTGQILTIDPTPSLEVIYKLTQQETPKTDHFSDQFEEEKITNVSSDK